MPLFGRTSVAASDAASKSVIGTLKETREAWPTVRTQLEPFLAESIHATPNLLDDEWTSFGLAVARIVVEMQALPLLLCDEEAIWVGDILMESLASMPGGDTTTALVSATDLRWRAAIANQVNPLPVAASALFEHWNLRELVAIDNGNYPNPTVLTILGWALLQPRAGWWKRYLKDHRINIPRFK